MSVQFIGFVGNHSGSEILPPSGPAVDPAYIEAAATIHENAGFDRVLMAFGSGSPESILVGQHVASVTRDLGLMIAHRPGFNAPTILARQLATLDHLTRGRVAVHIITGADDAELARDGDHLTKDERYARSGEYLDIVRASWTSTAPFDYQGKYYKVDQGFADVKPYQPGGIPVFVGGASPAAIEVSGRHADVYALWGETLEQVKELVARVRAAAAPHGRTPRFSLSLRPIIADTEEAAWARADQILERARDLARNTPHGRFRSASGHQPVNEGSRRLLAAAAQGTRLDKRLWTAIAAEFGARGNSTSLVGTGEQVAEALLDYYDIGIDHFLIRGFDPLHDAITYGRELLPRVRALVAERDAQRQAA